MRVLSEEQKNKTDQLLLTAPVKISDIILGKYLALLTIYVIPVLIMCLYPLLLGTHGTVSYAVSYTSILGYFLLGAAYISVGVFVSSITESQVIAAVVGFVILFLCYVESGIANFFPEGAGSSFFAFFIIIALVCLWIGSMIKNPDHYRCDCRDRRRRADGSLLYKIHPSRGQNPGSARCIQHGRPYG